MEERITGALILLSILAGGFAGAVRALPARAFLGFALGFVIGTLNGFGILGLVFFLTPAGGFLATLAGVAAAFIWSRLIASFWLGEPDWPTPPDEISESQSVP